MAQAAWNRIAQPLPPEARPSERSWISLTEAELALSLRGSLLAKQQRRIAQLEDELHRGWAEVNRLRNSIAAVERQHSDDDAARQVRSRPRSPYARECACPHISTRQPSGPARVAAEQLDLRAQTEVLDA